MRKPTDLNLRFERIGNSDTFSVKVTPVSKEKVYSEDVYRALVMGLVKLAIEGGIKDLNEYIQCIGETIKDMMENYMEVN